MIKGHLKSTALAAWAAAEGVKDLGHAIFEARRSRKLHIHRSALASARGVALSRLALYAAAVVALRSFVIGRGLDEDGWVDGLEKREEEASSIAVGIELGVVFDRELHDVGNSIVELARELEMEAVERGAA